MTQRGEPMAWLTAAAKSESDDCLLWPFAANPKGYGIVYHDRKSALAHRVVCRMAHGDAPEGKTETAHSCGNRRCCNPRHLRHASSAENKADMVVHGTRMLGEKNPRAKLTAVDVAYIRRSDERPSALAKRFGVSGWAITLARRGENWCQAH